MPLNEIPKYLTPEVRTLIEVALEDAWHELLKKDGALRATLTRNKLGVLWLPLRPLGKRTIASSSGSPSMLGEAHYKRSNRRQQYAHERMEWRLALSGAD